MKIVFLHMTMGLVNRGSEISTDLLASALAAKHKVLVIQSGPRQNRPYRVKVVYPQLHPPAAAPRNLLEKIFFRLRLNDSSRRARQFTLAAIPALTRFRPDIIVTTNGYLQSRLIRQLFPTTKIVIFGRAGIGHDDQANLQTNPDLFVALSPAALSWASQVAPTVKSVFIPNPLPTPKVVSKISLDLPRPVVLTVAALSRYKNILAVIRAVKGLQCSLLLIGDGEESGAVAEELGSFPGDFRWLRQVDPALMPTYYASSDIFCFVPESQEAFGRVYLEAMAAGLPIVASDDPIRRQIIGPQGIFVDPHDVDSVHEGIQRAHLKGKINYREQLKPYHISTVIKQIEGAFHDLLK